MYFLIDKQYQCETWKKVINFMTYSENVNVFSKNTGKIVVNSHQDITKYIGLQV